MAIFYSRSVYCTASLFLASRNSQRCMDSSLALGGNPRSVEELEGLIRYRARVAYDGNGFQGFQLQVNRRTIQGDLEQVLSRRFQRLVRVVGAGRTDSGVHARGQAIHFDLMDGEIQHQDLSQLEYSMNKMLRQDLRVYNLQVAPIVTKNLNGKIMNLPWNSMYDSTGKLYVYRISAAPHMDPLERHTRYNLKWKVPDVKVLERTLKHFEGDHDFRAFAGGVEQLEKHLPEGGVMDTTRTVYSINMIDEGEGMYRIEIHLKGALYKMVRNMIGTALDVALGRLSEEVFLDLLHRTNTGGRKDNKSKPAPPEGLTLEHVYYDDY